ncbi:MULTISPECIES: TetR/AcrR family transcriptional regulator [Actinomadura]|uniref:Regulatory protein, tetR family n=1 Tax=Actinomadura madurae TaxID=1993 RepID=A0A1I5FJI2_9ACTN|nr:TetR/AcrR family transcriptional regulator [Actinomadura madurae]SFO23917.1 regulatory protein, tetR family [Actinomadura madurae]SPT60434.1 transcriptional regulator BetI [Actinomadura madurae]
MPRTNPGRRRELTDAAIDLLAASGVHGVTHRAVERAAGLPSGTASNYFPSRETLLVATAERVVELHHADMDDAARRHESERGPVGIADLLAGSLLAAATTHRTRYRAIFELQLEATRRPALAAALAGLEDASVRFTAGHHAELGLAIPAEKIPVLITLYGGALFALVTAPPEYIGAELVRSIAHAIVHGALPA